MPAANDAAATPRVITTTTKSSWACRRPKAEFLPKHLGVADLYRDCDAQSKDRGEDATAGAAAASPSEDGVRGHEREDDRDQPRKRVLGGVPPLV